MSFDLFFILREIDSLTKRRDHLFSLQSEQEDRLSKLNIKRQDTEMQLILLNQNLIELNSELASLEKSISTSSVQRQRLLDLGGDEKKILRYTEEISALENKGLELLASLEGIELDLKELKIFRDGLGKTITEIEQEVRHEILMLNGEISQLDFRTSSLTKELPEDILNLIQKLFSKKLTHGPFTRVENGSCFFCRYQISRIEESEIDIQKAVKTCRQCSRIFLPYGV